MSVAVLFVCTANICRSAMAEGVLLGMARDAGLAAAIAVELGGNVRRIRELSTGAACDQCRYASRL